MKIEFTAKRVRLARVAIALVAISLAGYVAYAATQLSISNTGSVTTVGANWQGATFAPGTVPNCATATYSDTPSAITTWSVPASGSQTAGICVKNISTSSHTFTVTTTALTGSVTVAYSDATNPTPSATITSASILAGSTDLVTVTVSAGSASSGSLSFTTNIA